MLYLSKGSFSATWTMLIALLITVVSSSCSNSEEVMLQEPLDSTMYFPSISGTSWDTVSLNELGWNEEARVELYSFLETNNTRAFIILKEGKIVMEEYWGNNISNSRPFDRETKWYWASAGKTIISFLIGIAQENSLLDINDMTSLHLGSGWTGLEQNQENDITIRHQLSMTTGLDYESEDLCIDPMCLTYKAPPGEQWYYHNAPYLLLKDVITNASGQDYKIYTNTELASRIGMTGSWTGNQIELYWSSARDMARFGLLVLNEGTWDGVEILRDKTYFHEMVSSSQNLNPSYGYLYWLNGKNSIIYPGLERSFSQELSSAAPSDLYAAMGKNGQFIDIIPSQSLVVIRMGDAPDESLVPMLLHDEMWQHISAMIQAD